MAVKRFSPEVPNRAGIAMKQVSIRKKKTTVLQRYTRLFGVPPCRKGKEYLRRRTSINKAWLECFDLNFIEYVVFQLYINRGRFHRSWGSYLTDLWRVEWTPGHTVEFYHRQIPDMEKFLRQLKRKKPKDIKVGA